MKSIKGTRRYVAGMIVKEEKILLVKSTLEPFRNLWDFPRGCVRDGETPEQALASRICDQLNIHVDVASKLCDAVFDEEETRSTV